MKYLIVEDDPNLRLLWRSVLADLGHDVHEAATIDDARAALAAGDVDVMVLDLYLGRDNGLTLASVARDSNPRCHVIIVTGAADVRASDLHAQIPAIASVHRKPVDIEDLIATCARLDCDGDRAASL
ncbi:response regulator [Meridianimarinicoccus sp. RP-17]|uniref:response regulator n=1 Tax=Meridianimarinicoccus zhengii TaxID=2056810 RepID=UPI0013A6FD13|nr:response regulator [Phycocomes zhengii]